MPSVKVKGMHCDNCRKAVAGAVAKLAGVASVEVDLKAGSATWVDADPARPVSPDDVKKAINAIGFEA